MGRRVCNGGRWSPAQGWGVLAASFTWKFGCTYTDVPPRGPTAVGTSHVHRSRSLAHQGPGHHSGRVVLNAPSRKHLAPPSKPHEPRQPNKAMSIEVESR